MTGDVIRLEKSGLAVNVSPLGGAILSAHWHGIPVVLGMSLHCALDPLHMGDGIRMVSGTSFTLCELRPSGLTVTFAPQPSERIEKTTYTLDQLRAYEAALAG